MPLLKEPEYLFWPAFTGLFPSRTGSGSLLTGLRWFTSTLHQENLSGSRILADFKMITAG
jgi:hypothetical protein